MQSVIIQRFGLIIAELFISAKSDRYDDAS